MNKIVHLGPGAFFRAFGVPWLEEIGGWSVTGVSLRSPGVRDKLAANGYVYHALERGPEGVSVAKVTALSGILVAPEGREAVIDTMVDEAVSVVSLTITEKGYCYSAAKGGLDLGSSGVAHDLDNLERPETAPGFIVAALARRKAQGMRPFTCLSCDNLPENGKILRKVVLDLAGQVDPALADWIASEGRFPCTMVDRIVPATVAQDLGDVERLTGVRDAGVVMHEPFRQWVIEDDFVDGVRPAFEGSGVQLVRDVAPFEHMKLRCLNGTHSAIAYLGMLGGKASVFEATQDAAFAGFIRGIWAEEIVPSFGAPEGVDVGAYTKALMARYCNPGIEHRTAQIAMDGSQKLPQRILHTMADNLAIGRPVKRLGLVVAAWVHFLRGDWEISDPLVGPLRAAAMGDDPVSDILGMTEIFDAELAGDPRFVGAVQAGYERLAGAAIDDVLEAVA